MKEMKGNSICYLHGLRWNQNWFIGNQKIQTQTKENVETIQGKLMLINHYQSFMYLTTTLWKNNRFPFFFYSIIGKTAWGTKYAEFTAFFHI